MTMTPRSDMFSSADTQSASTSEKCHGTNIHNYDESIASGDMKPLPASERNNCRNKVRRRARLFSNHHKWISRINPFLLMVCFLVFAIMAASGIGLWHSFVLRSRERAERDAVAIAIDTGNWFSDQLSNAIQPLYTMTNYATEIEAFAALPYEIGAIGTNGSLPVIVDAIKGSNETGTKRNITGTCDRPELVSRFEKIASDVTHQAHMEDVLANVQFAPYGVVCLLYPLVWNFTTFEGEMVSLDNTDAFGRDLLNDVRHRDKARNALKGTDISIVGPRPLIQCPDCGDFFIARLPVVADDLELIIQDEASNSTIYLPRWGYTTVLINWNALVEGSNVHQRFETRGMAFQLTRNDTMVDNVTNTTTSSITIMAETAHLDKSKYSCTTSTDITGPDWTWNISIHYNNAGVTMMATIIVITVTLIVAAGLSFLLYTVLTQKQVQIALKGQALAQEAKIDLEKKLTAYFSHELRNPLSAMETAVELMPLNEMSEESLELLNSIRTCSSFMSNIMNNLLDARKIEEGKMTLRKQPLSIRSLVQNVANMARPSVKSDVVLETDIQTMKVNDYVYGDELRLQQILINIVSNSIKYTTQGSIILVARWIKLQQKELCKNEVLCFEVCDSGPGIPKDEVDLVFERFVQRGGAPGSGLGLAIAKQLVELMDGTIHFESDPTLRPGSKCIITVPLDMFILDRSTSTSEIFTPTKGNDESMIESPVTILIVDDIKMNRTMLKRRFLKYIAPNCEITEASSGEEALKIVENDSFDIIIQDHYMEDGGGILVGTDVVAAMRRAKIDSIIIGCSGNEVNDRFIAAGADLAWNKPMPSNQEILRSLKTLLAEKTGC